MLIKLLLWNSPSGNSTLARFDSWLCSQEGDSSFRGVCWCMSRADGATSLLMLSEPCRLSLSDPQECGKGFSSSSPANLFLCFFVFLSAAGPDTALLSLATCTMAPQNKLANLPATQWSLVHRVWKCWHRHDHILMRKAAVSIQDWYLRKHSAFHIENDVKCSTK